MKCRECDAEVPLGSRFCNHCGAAVVAVEPPSQLRFLEERAGRRTALLKAASEYAVDDANPLFQRAATLKSLLAFELCREILLGQAITDAKAVPDPGRLLEHWPEHTPAVLDSGLVLTTSLAEEARFAQLASLATLRGGIANRLQEVLVTMQDRASQLLVDGKSRALVEGVTLEAAYARAEVFWNSMEAGDLDSALTGFESLRDLVPEEGYFRSVLADIYIRRNQLLEALHELVYARWLDPEAIGTSYMLLRTLVAFGLSPVALDIAEEFDTRFKPTNDHERSQCEWAQRFARVARLESCAAASLLAGVLAEDVQGDGPAVFDVSPVLHGGWPGFELPPPAVIGPLPHPWFCGKERGETPYVATLQGRRLFVCYRRSDAPDAARKLARDLRNMVHVEVFMDEASLYGGTKWRAEIRDAIDRSDWVVALIGERWSVSRLHDSDDVVRRELERAFAQRRTVLPVLVDDALTPHRNELPPSLQQLLQRQFVRWSSEASPFPVLEAMRTTLHPENDVDLEYLAEAPEEQVYPMLLEILPRYLPRKAAKGQGLLQSQVHLHGTWEIQMAYPNGDGATIKVDILDEPRSPFRGTVSFLKAGQSGGKRVRTMEGDWAVLFDVDKKLILGLYLHGVFDGAEEFALSIPMTRTLGPVLHGRDADGVSYSSKNVKPITL